MHGLDSHWNLSVSIDYCRSTSIYFKGKLRYFVYCVVPLFPATERVLNGVNSKKKKEKEEGVVVSRNGRMAFNFVKGQMALFCVCGL